MVVVFVQIWPEVKRRQFKQALDAYEAAMDDQAPSRKWPGRGRGGRQGRLPGAIGMTGYDAGAEELQPMVP